MTRPEQKDRLLGKPSPSPDMSAKEMERNAAGFLLHQMMAGQKKSLFDPPETFLGKALGASYKGQTILGAPPEATYKGQGTEPKKRVESGKTAQQTVRERFDKATSILDYATEAVRPVGALLERLASKSPAIPQEPRIGAVGIDKVGRSRRDGWTKSSPHYFAPEPRSPESQRTIGQQFADPEADIKVEATPEQKRETLGLHAAKARTDSEMATNVVDKAAFAVKAGMLEKAYLDPFFAGAVLVGQGLSESLMLPEVVGAVDELAKNKLAIPQALGLIPGKQQGDPQVEEGKVSAWDDITTGSPVADVALPITGQLAGMVGGYGLTRGVIRATAEAATKTAGKSMASRAVRSAGEAVKASPTIETAVTASAQDIAYQVPTGQFDALSVPMSALSGGLQAKTIGGLAKSITGSRTLAKSKAIILPPASGAAFNVAELEARALMQGREVTGEERKHAALLGFGMGANDVMAMMRVARQSGGLRRAQEIGAAVEIIPKFLEQGQDNAQAILESIQRQGFDWSTHGEVNILAWAKQAEGRDVSVREFMDSPEIQSKVFEEQSGRLIAESLEKEFYKGLRSDRGIEPEVIWSNVAGEVAGKWKGKRYSKSTKEYKKAVQDAYHEDIAARRAEQTVEPATDVKQEPVTISMSDLAVGQKFVLASDPNGGVRRVTGKTEHTIKYTTQSGSGELSTLGKNVVKVIPVDPNLRTVEVKDATRLEQEAAEVAEKPVVESGAPEARIATEKTNDTPVATEGKPPIVEKPVDGADVAPKRDSEGGAIGRAREQIAQMRNGTLPDGVSDAYDALRQLHFNQNIEYGLPGHSKADSNVIPPDALQARKELTKELQNLRSKFPMEAVLPKEPSTVEQTAKSEPVVAAESTVTRRADVVAESKDSDIGAPTPFKKSHIILERTKEGAEFGKLVRELYPDHIGKYKGRTVVSSEVGRLDIDELRARRQAPAEEIIAGVEQEVAPLKKTAPKKPVAAKPKETPKVEPPAVQSAEPSRIQRADAIIAKNEYGEGIYDKPSRLNKKQQDILRKQPENVRILVAENSETLTSKNFESRLDAAQRDFAKGRMTKERVDAEAEKPISEQLSEKLTENAPESDEAYYKRSGEESMAEFAKSNPRGVGDAPKSGAQVILEFKAETGAPLVKGRLRGAKGYYRPKTGEAGFRYSGDLDTTMKEASRWINDKVGLLKDANFKELDAELSYWSSYGKLPAGSTRHTKRQEGIAKFMQAWAINPIAAEAKSPKLAALIQEKIPQDWLRSMKKFGDEYQRHIGLADIDKVMAQIGGETRSFKDRVKEYFGIKDAPGTLFEVGILDTLRGSLQDDYWYVVKAIRLANERIAGGGVLPSEDAEILLRLLGGSVGKFDQVIKNGHLNPDGTQMDTAMSYTDLFSGISGYEKMDAAFDDRLKRIFSGMISERVIEKEKSIYEELAEEIAKAKQSAVEKIAESPDKRVAIEARLTRKIADLQNAARDQAGHLSGVGKGIEYDPDVHRGTLEALKSDPELWAEAQEFSKRYRQFADNNLQYAVRAGYMGQAEYDRIKSHNQYYVAMERIAGEGDEFRSGAKTRAQNITHQFRGSGKEIENPVHTLLDQTYRVMRTVDYNSMLGAFTKILDLPRNLYAPASEPRFEIGKKVDKKVSGAIKVRRNGKVEYWQFEDHIHNTLSKFEHLAGSDNVLLGKAVDFLALPANLVRGGVVYFPAFLIRNYVRDAQYRALVSETGSTPFGQLNLGRYEQEFEARGGSIRSYFSAAADTHKKVIAQTIRRNQGGIVSTAAKMRSGIEHFYKMNEMRGRLAEYRSALGFGKNVLGYSDYDASLYAAAKARALLDFAIQGSLLKITRLNRLVPFLNPGIQGLARTGRALVHQPIRTLSMFGLYSMIPAALEMAWNVAEDDLEEWRELPGYKRDFFYNFKVAPDLWIHIPRPFDFGVGASLFQRSFDKALGNDRAFEGYGTTLVEALVPFQDAIFGGGWKSIYEAFRTNKDSFRDRYIVPPADEKVDLDLRDMSKASSAGQTIGKFLRVDARQIDHVVGGFGGTGTFLLALSNIGREDKPAMAPLRALSGITGHSPGSDALSVKKAWDRLYGRKEANSIEAEILRANQKSLNEAKNKGSEVDAAAKAYRGVAREIVKKYDGKPYNRSLNIVPLSDSLIQRTHPILEGLKIEFSSVEDTTTLDGIGIKFTNKEHASLLGDIGGGGHLLVDIMMQNPNFAKWPEKMKQDEINKALKKEKEKLRTQHAMKKYLTEKK